MTALEPRLITPFKDSGLSQYWKPFLIGQEAFPDIQDAYSWRGDVVKREGFRLLAALPAGPVQGLKTFFVQSSTDQRLVAFNTTTAFLFDDGTETFVDISTFGDATVVTWTGGNDDFFWSCNYANSLWVTNTYNTNNDSLRFWNGQAVNGWGNQTPNLRGVAPTNTTLATAFICIPYKGRLILLKTKETSPGPVTVAFNQRARWSQRGSPYVPDATLPVLPAGFTSDADAWRDDIPGRGGFADADTNEEIVSAAIIKDILIVFFERSTWRLVYTGNETAPFYWERINTQFGSESVLSTVSFDDFCMTFSRYGWVKADTNTVQRIDLSIPNISFNVYTESGLDGLKRVHGVRDFYRMLTYFTYPYKGSTIANQIYMYNYAENSWAQFNQLFRCFGEYYIKTGTTWAQLNTSDDTWEKLSSSDDIWKYLGGNIGFPFILAGDANTSGPLSGNVYITYEFQGGSVAQDYIDTAAETNFNFSVTTKQFNPYLQQGLRCKLAYFDLYVTQLPGSAVTIDHMIDGDDTPILTRTVTLNQANNPNTRYVRVFLGAIARLHQIKIYLSPAQLADAQAGTAQFDLQGIVLWTSPCGRIKS